MVKKMEHAKKAFARAMVLILLFTTSGSFVACGKKEPERDGLVPMETAKSYEHVAKVESGGPAPDSGGTQTDPGGQEGDPAATATVVPPSPTPVEPGGGSENEDIVYVAVSKLNLRAEPSLDAEVIAQAKYGDAFVRTEKGTQGWDKLLYEGREVYAFAEYLTDKKIAGADGFSGQFVADVKKK